ncbi:hypothetical protein EON65_31765 [archaeon]|nr:MAG: hypothetical protein EON65_31765 [archaeon]
MRHDNESAPAFQCSSINSTLAELDLSRLAKRLVSEDGLKDENFAHLVIEEYKKFFFTLAECSCDAPCPIYLPSPLVDLVWQRHMLDTANYFTDCDRFDLPQGYCHRHELLGSNNSWINSSTTVKEEGDDYVFAQKHYSFTLQAYKTLYGCAAPQAIWPTVYDYGARVENRKVVGKFKATDDGVEGNTQEEKRYISYAVPHANISSLTLSLSATTDIASYQLPTEETLVKNLTWVGELVFDTLPLKQLKCVQGEVISKISFNINPIQSEQRSCMVRKVVVEYARFLLLLMRQAQFELSASQESRELKNTLEITPSKLVDELWHAHILCSPAYFAFW